MTYAEHLPDLALSSCVECYWVLHSSPSEHIDYRRILPDGCTDIIFNFSRPLVSRSGSETHLNTFTSFIVGNMTRPVFSRPLVSYEILAIRFKPGGLYSLMGIPLDQFTDEVVDLADYEPFDNWFDQLAGQSGTERRIQYLNSLLLPRVNWGMKISRIQYALKQIYHHQGSFRITALAKETGLSQRQLERQFRTVVGLSPKQLARVVQFQHMIGMLRTKGEESLLQLAADGGYSDHAHFTRAFKEFSGITPQEFLRAW